MLPFHVWGLGLGHICFWSHHSTYHSRYRVRKLVFLTSINSMIIATLYFYLFLFGCARSQVQQERSSWTGARPSLPHVKFLVVACELSIVASGILFPDQGSNLSPLHWERRVLATRPPGNSQ